MKFFLQVKCHFSPNKPTKPCTYIFFKIFFHTVYHEDGISVLGTNRSHLESNQESMGNEEGFQIHIQSLQSWQLVKCVEGHCPARAEHCKSVPRLFLTISCHYTSIRMHMHRLMCNLAQDNQS